MRFTITLAAGTDDGYIRDIPITIIERADDTFTAGIDRTAGPCCRREHFGQAGAIG